MYRKVTLILLASFLFPQGYNMDMVGFLDFGQNTSDITGFYQDNREFAVVGFYIESAAFIDITNPSNPFEVGRIDGSINL